MAAHPTPITCKAEALAVKFVGEKIGEALGDYLAFERGQLLADVRTVARLRHDAEGKWWSVRVCAGMAWRSWGKLANGAEQPGMDNWEHCHDGAAALAWAVEKATKQLKKGYAHGVGSDAQYAAACAEASIDEPEEADEADEGAVAEESAAAPPWDDDDLDWSCDAGMSGRPSDSWPAPADDTETDEDGENRSLNTALVEDQPHALGAVVGAPPLTAESSFVTVVGVSPKRRPARAEAKQAVRGPSEAAGGAHALPAVAAGTDVMDEEASAAQAVRAFERCLQPSARAPGTALLDAYDLAIVVDCHEKLSNAERAGALVSRLQGQGLNALSRQLPVGDFLVVALPKPTDDLVPGKRRRKLSETITDFVMAEEYPTPPAPPASQTQI
ncbi:hypothetical protein Ctob_011267 [Chrysochromulina tobinii]|uniref:Uncharacterized protein n=1 Tax=Chrysochromulina tobinii TaxID=1460289 RepID=A0A0M0KD24_9EUKA|nr:hypothetical protein Ctob_011267 [Chrysochromulina tobinii]|eukprot:KOO36457.1 hypothetical protein Ctob_011267 [Chrysochromulina sp. CCMP291]